MNNIIPEILSDDLFDKLWELDLFDEVKLRNYKIRKEYQKLRREKIKSPAAIEMLLTEYPYLQFDTVRKIVCVPPKKKSIL